MGWVLKVPSISLKHCIKSGYFAGWQKLREGVKEGPLPKSLDSDENFKPLFCRDIKICRDLCTFWKTLVKTVFLWQEVHYYTVYIAYFTELNLQI